MLGARIGVVALAALLAAREAHAQFLLVADSVDDRVMLLDAASGVVLQPDFITEFNPGGGYNFDTPKHAIQVGREIWVVDQTADAVHRFTASLSPAYLGSITGVDNARALRVVGDRVYLSNAQGGNGATPNAIRVYQWNGDFVTQFSANAPYGIAILGSNTLLIGDIDNDSIVRYTTSGVYIGEFHDSDGINGIDLPQQLEVAPTGPSGAAEIWAAGTASPAGIYRYAADGSQVGYYAVTPAARGVWPMADGSVLFTDAQGIRRLSPALAVADLVHPTAGAQFFGRLDLAAPPCTADVDDGTFTGQRDQAVGIEDLIYYLALFENGLIEADLDNGSGTGTRDGGVGIEDLVYFLARFAQGC